MKNWLTRQGFGLAYLIGVAVLLWFTADIVYDFGHTLGAAKGKGEAYGRAAVAIEAILFISPMLFGSAWKARRWSMAAVAGLIWGVTALASLIGVVSHTTDTRAIASATREFKGVSKTMLEKEITKAEQEKSWIPAHRPAAAVKAAMTAEEKARFWKRTDGCKEVFGKDTRAYCVNYAKLQGELASAENAGRLQNRIENLQKQFAEAGAVVDKDTGAVTLASWFGVDRSNMQAGLATYQGLTIWVVVALGGVLLFMVWDLGHGIFSPKSDLALAGAGPGGPLMPPPVPVQMGFRKEDLAPFKFTTSFDSQPGSLPAVSVPPASVINITNPALQQVVLSNDLEKQIAVARDFIGHRLLRVPGMQLPVESVYEAFIRHSYRSGVIPLETERFEKEVASVYDEPALNAAGFRVFRGFLMREDSRVIEAKAA